jgi:hypothetical protein
MLRRGRTIEVMKVREQRRRTRRRVEQRNYTRKLRGSPTLGVTQNLGRTRLYGPDRQSQSH